MPQKDENKDPNDGKEDTKSLAFVIFLVFLPSIIFSALVLYGLYLLIKALIKWIKKKSSQP